MNIKKAVSDYLRQVIEYAVAKKRLEICPIMHSSVQYKGMDIYINDDAVLVHTMIGKQYPAIIIAEFANGTEGIVINHAYTELPEEIQIAGYEHEIGHSVHKHNKNLTWFQKARKSDVYMKAEYEADAYAVSQVGKEAVIGLLTTIFKAPGTSKSELNKRLNAIHKGN